MKMIKIYALKDPETEQIRYVGKTEKYLNKRLSGHLSSKETNHKYHWINSLKVKNLEPIISILEECTEDIWEEREKYWISYYRKISNLTNLTDGGKGNQNQFFSKASQEKKSKSLKGRIVSQKTRDKISKALTGKKLSEETKEKVRQANIGKKYSLEVKMNKSKPVIQMDLEGSEISEFYGLCEASRVTNCSKGAIQNACCGRAKTSGGFKWKYK